MQIVINIPEKVVKAIQNGKDYRYDIHTAIAQGTPLLKGHGDLIDKNEIIKRYEGDCGRRIYVDNFIHDIELNTSTIIKADKEDTL